MYFTRLDNGTITRINYNNQVRDSVFQAQSVHEVKAFYQALSLFDRLAYETENHVVYKLKRGKTITLSVSHKIGFKLFQVIVLSLTTKEFYTEEKVTP